MLQRRDLSTEAWELDFQGTASRPVESGYVRSKGTWTAPTVTSEQVREVRSAIASRKNPVIRKLMRNAIRGRAL